MTEKQDYYKKPKIRKRYNAAEFIEFTENKPESERYELINGRIYLMAAPNVSHQDIAGNIYGELRNYLKGKKCRVFIAGLDVVLFKKEKEDQSKSQNVFQPDVFVVCDPDKIKKDRIYGAPDFVAEVVSPSNKEHDYFKKLEVYMKYGVKEYWIVDPGSREIFVKINGHDEGMEYSFDDKVKVGIFDEDDFYIDFKELQI